MRPLRSIFLLVAASCMAVAQEAPVPGLAVLPGAVNGAFIERNGKLLAVYGDPSGNRPGAGMVLITHARRDVVWAARSLLAKGAKAVVPEKEADLLVRPEKFWGEFREKRFHDYAQRSTKVPIEAIRPDRTVKEGDTLEWEGLSIRVLETPGYTRGAVTYLADLGGKKVAFTGDLIRDDGKLQDLFSLQDAIPSARIGGYHGWAGRLGDLVTSLGKVAAERPDVIVPARGPVLRDPRAAIDRLLARIRSAYSNYLSVDALRWYFKDGHILVKAQRVLGPDARVDWMPMAETLPLPDWIVPISNSRLLLAADRSGLLVDCGGAKIVEELKKMRAGGKLASIGEVFITHYHDDHTDALPLLAKEFGSGVTACGSLVDVLERPGDYRLPCLTKNPVAVAGKRRDGESWRWKEFKLTIHDFPGQTLHHNALLVERDGGVAAFFAGDSFTPSGIDDYCLQNRNFLGEGRGFLRCLDIVEKLPAGCLLLNQHVGPAFRFTPEQVARMRETIRKRALLLADLFPFDAPDYGLDEGWAALHPYSVAVAPGESARLALRITNHSPRERTFRAAPRPPEGLTAVPAGPVRIAARADGEIGITVGAPPGAAPGVRVLAAGVAWEDGELREWVEALVEVRE